MSSINASIIKVINQYTAQYLKQIEELKLENTWLKQNSETYNQLNKDHQNLHARHTEIKQAYIESERENNQLRLTVNDLKKDQASLIHDVETHFQDSLSEMTQSQTPRKPTRNLSQPNQKILHRNAKSRYELDSENENSDNEYNSKRYLNFGTSNIINLNIDDNKINEGKQDDKQMDTEMEIMKKLIEEGNREDFEMTNQKTTTVQPNIHFPIHKKRSIPRLNPSQTNQSESDLLNLLINAMKYR